MLSQNFTVGSPEVFFFNASDPWELTNLAGARGTDPGRSLLHKTMPLAAFMGSCSGLECSGGLPPSPPPINATQPLQCYIITPVKGVQGGAEY